VYHKKQNKKPSYKFSDFKKACKNKENIFIFSDVYKFADMFFNLRTKEQILSFVRNNGLENKILYNTVPWKNNPDKKTPIMVDSYEFESGNKKGYIAFFYNKSSNKWTIKSFHLSRNMDYD
jgi:hypothetical protein